MPHKTRGEYRSVALPKTQMAIVSAIAEDPYLGYSSEADVVRDAVRRLFIELKILERDQDGRFVGEHHEG